MIAQLDKLYIKTRRYKVYVRLLSYLFFEGRPLTTKGQWINPLVFLNYRIASVLPKFKKVQKPIFIVGTGRSGTTILGVLLSMHKDVAFLNEPKAIWNFAYPHEDLIGSYSEDTAYYRLTAKDTTPALQKKVRNIYSYYLSTTFSKRVVDKYPELIFRTEWVRGVFPDAKFLFLVRNGWDTCASIKSWSKRHSVSVLEEQHDWWGRNNRKWKLLVDQVVASDKELSPFQSQIAAFSDHVDMAAVEWILTMKEGLSRIEAGEDMYLVKYERLVQDPASEMEKIFKYCELPNDSKALDYAIKTMTPAADKEPFTINSLILPEFKRVMQLLGY